MWSLPSETAAESDDDWDLGAVVRSCRLSTAPTAESSPNFSWFPMLRAAGEEEQQVTAAEAGKGGSFLGFPDLLQCSDGLQELEEVDTDGPLAQIPRPKRRKNQQKIVVRRLADDALSSDVWAWRKYGQKPIKGSPNPRGYYRCGSSKSCLARKQVERNRADPATFIITYTAEHNNPASAHRSSLAGSTRQKFPSLTLATAAAAGGGGTGERGGSPTTQLIGTMEGEDDDEDDEEVLLVENMDILGEDDLLFMNDEREPVSAGVATAR